MLSQLCCAFASESTHICCENIVVERQMSQIVKFTFTLIVLCLCYMLHCTLYMTRQSVSSDFVVLYIYIYFLFSLPFSELSLVGLALDVVD